MSTANYKLTINFAAFFKRINPSPTYKKAAASAHSQITALIEDHDGPAGDLRIRCFLQGSYRRETAIHTINDVDIVALCSLSHTSAATQNTRDQIFEMIADAIACNAAYKGKIRYRKRSVCIKVDLESVKIEILPALRVKGKPYTYEPFYMYRPNEDESLDGYWQRAFARYHQESCTQKNSGTDGLFIPMIKVLKHLRIVDSYLSPEDAISFHIECLLYALKDSIYSGSICDCIEAVLRAIAGFTPDKAEQSDLKSPCKDRNLFGPTEWDIVSYRRFHKAVGRWYEIASSANQEDAKDKAISAWKQLLGDGYFPRDPQ